MLHTLGAAVTVLAAGDIPDPGMGTAPPGQVKAGVTTLLGWGAWIVFALAVAGVLVVAAMMIMAHRRGEGGQHAAGLLWVGGGCLLGASAAAVVGGLTG